MTQVYRIDKIDTHGNSHAVNRDETWSLAKDKIFPTREEAVAYVISMNRRLCGYDLGILDCRDEAIIGERCSSQTWAHKQRFFVDKPDVNYIKARLQAEHIRVI